MSTLRNKGYSYSTHRLGSPDTPTMVNGDFQREDLDPSTMVGGKRDIDPSTQPP